MKGGLGGFNVNKLMKQAKQMQDQMAKVQEELKERVVEASAGGGMVTAYFNGQQELVSLKINPEVIKSEDVGMLEDLITAAINQAVKKSKDLAQEEMNKVTGGLGPGLIPGM
jgi:DNA-binding YbaB/EbfC family protein